MGAKVLDAVLETRKGSYPFRQRPFLTSESRSLSFLFIRRALHEKGGAIEGTRRAPCRHFGYVAVVEPMPGEAVYARA